MGPGARGRYRRFLGFWFASGLSEMDGEGLLVPKMHAVLQMLAFLILWGAIDNARLGDAEKDHQPYVKKAVQCAAPGSGRPRSRTRCSAWQIASTPCCRSGQRSVIPFSAGPDARRRRKQPPNPFATRNLCSQTDCLF